MLGQFLPMANQAFQSAIQSAGGVPTSSGLVQFSPNQQFSALSPLTDGGTSTGQVFRTIGPVGGQVSTPIDAQGNPIGPGFGATPQVIVYGPDGTQYANPAAAAAAGVQNYSMTSSVPGGSNTNIIGNLPALRGTASGESRIDPTLRPYLGMGLQRAEQLFFGQPPSLYPGQMYVSPSEQTLEALGAQEALARQGQGPLLAGQQAYNQALAGTGFTAGGGFLQGSPFRDMAIQSAVRPLMQQFEQTTLPGIQSAFSRAGRYGSGAQERAIGQATEATGRAIGDISAQIAAADYARERQFQQQALAQQAVLGGLAPQFYQSQFLPAQTLAQVGQARETIAAQPLQEAIQRYQFSQQIPYQQLQGFLSSVYGTPMAQSQFQTPQAARTNYLGQGIGGALLGSQVGSLFGGIGGLSGAQTGAILGGLGGLLL